jgi:pimeloyl-ACP methyl ester carboxylesterase
MPDGIEIQTAAGRTVRFYDSGAVGSSTATMFWHHGTPQTGRILPPIAKAAGERGIRVVSVARPAYEGSTALVGRSVADAAADVIRVADELGIDRFFTAGASGGGPHALGCAALAPGRVSAVITLAGIAPYVTDYDWFAGMAAPEALQSALKGRDPRALFAETADFNEDMFIAPDWGMLSGDWQSLGSDSEAAGSEGPGGEIDDDVAYVSPWGFDLTNIQTPVLLYQGDLDRVVPASHAAWQHAQLPNSELRERPGDGHISVLAALPDALDWALAHP